MASSEDVWTEDELQEFDKTGELNILDPVKNLVEKIFEVTMIYPLTLSTQIPPDIFENLTPIQKSVYETCKDLLKDEDYFFILNLIKLCIVNYKIRYLVHLIQSCGIY